MRKAATRIVQTSALAPFDRIAVTTLGPESPGFRPRGVSGSGAANPPPPRTRSSSASQRAEFRAQTDLLGNWLRVSQPFANFQSSESI
jgi:hypothetical protein